METTFDFSEALRLAKEGKVIARKGWNNSDILVKVQFPDENSANTEPYLYMIKRAATLNDKMKRFPLDLSCESIFAEDWFEVVAVGI